MPTRGQRSSRQERTRAARGPSPRRPARPRPAELEEPAPEQSDEELAGGDGEEARPAEEEEGTDGGEDGGGEGKPRRGGPRSPGPASEEERRILDLLERHQEDAPRRRGAAPARKAPPRFEIVEHTADVGIRARGETLEQAFENAALGMFNILTDPSKVAPLQDFEVVVEGDDLKDLLHDWLSQLLALSQVNGMLFSGFRVQVKPLDARYSLSGWAMGEPADPARHVYRTEIKAVTRHLLEVNESSPSVKVLFDI